MITTKITKGNHSDKHRDQLIKDMIYVCSIEGVSKRTRREFLDKCISWPFSDYSAENIEKSAKLKGCEYWSEAALDLYKNYLKRKKEKKKVESLESQLRHEHVVPRRIFINAMENYFSQESFRQKLRLLNSTDELQNVLNEEFDTISKLMNEKLKGCVVTKKEAENIDKGEKNSKEFQSSMPPYAYENNLEPKNDFEKFSKIENVWARYTRLNIVIKKVEWVPKSKGWGDIISEKLMDDM